jgi:hypothetical protein
MEAVEEGLKLQIPLVEEEPILLKLKKNGT